MKKLLIGFIAIISFTVQSKAQYRPVEGDRTFTVGINGLDFLGFNSNASRTGSLLFRQYMADNMAVRASLNLNANISGTSQDDTANGFITTSNFNNIGINLAGGLQKSLGERTRVEPYVGADLMFGIQRGRNISRTEVTDATKTMSFNDVNGDFNETLVTNSNPLNIGITPLIGFNYYIVEGISIGGEFGYGINAGFFMQRRQVITSRANGTDAPKQESIIGPGGMNFSMQNFGFSNVVLSVLF